MLPIAQGNALGREGALIKVSRSVRAACIMRGNAPLGVKGINGLRAFGAWHFCAGAKMPNVSIAVYVPPGRCPGLCATFGLSARPNHLLGVCANSFICMHLWLRLGIVQVNLALRSPCTNVQLNTTNFKSRRNPSLVTGLRCKLYTRNAFDYSWLCELVLG